MPTNAPYEFPLILHKPIGQETLMDCTVIDRLKGPEGTSYSFPRCGKCTACRIQRRRLWTGRMLLEKLMDPRPATFWTLTYDDARLPEGGTLVKSHVQDWMKRLRIEAERKFDLPQVRMYTVGEYGERYGRPHYHAITYGMSVTQADALRQTWEKYHGFTRRDAANTARFRYVAKYVEKKIINAKAPDYEDGRLSEFSVMSRRPGIGFTGYQKMAEELIANGDNQFLKGYWAYDGCSYPIGRYGQEVIVRTLSEYGLSPTEVKDLTANMWEDGDPQDRLIETLNRRYRNAAQVKTFQFRKKNGLAQRKGQAYDPATEGITALPEPCVRREGRSFIDERTQDREDSSPDCST